MLKSNQNRSAHDSIRGYVYQIWQSVYSWIQLSEDQHLYLEAAEDIDKFSTEGVETTQVKDTQGSSITLRSKGVIEAINNYWELCTSNPNQKIVFRYLTTSPCTVEQGKPFGTIGGLEVWNQIKVENEADIAKFKAFLCNEKDDAGEFKFSEKLRTFLSTATLFDIYNYLISPVRWHYNQPNLGEVKRFVENLLVLHGNRFEILPNDSKAIAPILLQRALDCAASKEKRPLNRVDFLEIFESECFTKVPSSLVRGLFKQIQQGNLSESVSLLIPDFYQSIPDILFTHFRREFIIKKLAEVISKNDFLFLNGLSGSGKTTLAKLVAKETRHDWMWVGLRGIKDEKTVVESLSRIVAYAYRTPTIDRIIIDDLALRANTGFAEQKLEELTYLIVRERKGKIMMTTLDSVSHGLKNRLGLNEDSIYPVPSFSESEILELLIQFGLTDNKKARLLAQLILGKTKGHVQLVHAYVSFLKGSNFDSSVNAVLSEQPAGVADLKKYALQTITELYDQTTQNFIFKLTLIDGIFTKEQALRIAKHSPSVPNPGIAFDRITGAWIEPLGHPYFRISPLIESTAHEILDTESINDLHRVIANAIFDSQSLSLNEFSTAFFHSWKAQDEETLKRGALGALKEPNKNFWKNLSEYIFWFANINTDRTFGLFSKNARVNNLLRAVQYKIAAHQNQSVAATICKLMDTETELNGPKSDLDAIMNRIQFIFIVVALSEPVKLPTAYLLKLIFELKSIVERHPEFEILNELPVIPDAISDGMGNSKTDISSLFLMIIPRCGTFSDFNEALELIDTLSLSEKSFLFRRVGDSDFLNDHWISLVINNESKVKNPDWNTALTILENWIPKTLSWNLNKFSSAMIKGCTHINVEFLKDLETAYKICENAPPAIRESFTIQNAKANVLYEKRDYTGANRIWRIILGPEHSSDDPFVIYSYRSAAIAESKGNQFSNSYNYLIRAYSLAKRIGHLKRPLGYKVDAAYCLWKLADFKGFLTTMHEIMLELETIPNDSNDVSNFGLHKMIGHSLCWYIANIRNQIVDLFEPVVGVCSNPNLNEEVLSLIQTPIEYSWLNLVSIEREVGLSNKIFLEQYERLAKCTFPLVRRQIRVFQLEQFFHTQPESIIELCAKARMENAMEEKVGRNLNMQMSVTEYELSELDKQAITVNSLIFITLFLLYEKEFDQVKIIKVIDELVSRNSNLQCSSLFDQLGELKQMTVLDGGSLISILQDGSKTYYVRILSAVLIFNRSDFGNEAVFYANSIICRFLFDVRNANVSNDPIAERMTQYWLKATKSPAFFRLPQTTIPKIIDACNGPLKGLPKIASILLATYEGVNLVVDDATIKGWREILEA